ncbi:metalloendopeptidase OMA1, mitochondrial-like [Nasonia vitripennis]|uniref:Metalloendopeptidase OMA1, mitochondrial n=1 Tax=Nasonia vitripennis TaxID=7425 RepID=A0A7M7H781_NASVI|nr:metalloendopeptidase OMA1, mitochondrial-like [Nasonia vitripennis]XP_008210237.1 metalloendopeptidase OMA1, mitochondrial-like [Nasonia vitripennis]XP_008210238.1 metalloendopeptidase OMA1, mitochondrial-like [Nasonia vitripennis]XP_016843973.1 metalloendopeptidase OMA1, mitochondrial-like [Nasonia vitripennis]XP_016843974.1 metalloendopeptidase OMA1, mitochondrial-like [Nasonia vitripennis]XP_031778245.1 metalloendopeptidase OMA1, mitochondrial-like [Nasonia vitripennis]
MSIARIARVTNCLANSRFKIASCAISCQSYTRVRKLSQVQYKSQVQVLQLIKAQKCNFHTSERRDIHPVLAVIIRPVIRIAALIFGRKFKKWYASRTPEEREEFLKWFRAKRKYFLGFISLYFFSLFLYYLAHLEYDPITKRSQFIMLNEKQQEKLAKLTFETHLQEFQSILLPKTHPTYSKLLRVTAKLINANRDMPNFKNKKWTLTVVDSPLKNAYVLPGGNIFVFMGTLQMVENDDQLAIVLAHEMAHAVLKHSYEQVSRGIIIELMLALPIAATWAVFPDLLAGFLLLLGQSIVDVFHTLPYSRALETEADTIGLLIAAKACIDIREAVVFWGTMRTLTDLEIEPNQIPWLSTHPDHGDREKRINDLLTQALQFRSKAGCPALSNVDPRILFYQRSREQQLQRLKQRGVIHT